MVSRIPSENGTNGDDWNRDDKGRFGPGNKGGPGNPYLHQIHTFRSALFAATTAEDVQAIVRKLIEQAKNGDVTAAKLFFDRILGPAGTEVAFILDGNSGGVLVAPPGVGIAEWMKGVSESNKQKRTRGGNGRTE